MQISDNDAWRSMHTTDRLSGSRLPALLGFFGKEVARTELVTGQREITEEGCAAMELGKLAEPHILNAFVNFLQQHKAKFDFSKAQCIISYTANLRGDCLLSTNDGSIVFHEAVSMAPFVPYQRYPVEAKFCVKNPQNLTVKATHLPQLCLEAMSLKTNQAFIIYANDNEMTINFIDFPHFYIARFMSFINAFDDYKHDSIDFATYYTNALAFRRMTYAISHRFITYSVKARIVR